MQLSKRSFSWLHGSAFLLFAASAAVLFAFTLSLTIGLNIGILCLISLVVLVGVLQG